MQTKLLNITLVKTAAFSVARKFADFNCEHIFETFIHFFRRDQFRFVITLTVPTVKFK